MEEDQEELALALERRKSKIKGGDGGQQKSRERTLLLMHRMLLALSGLAQRGGESSSTFQWSAREVP